MYLLICTVLFIIYLFCTFKIKNSYIKQLDSYSCAPVSIYNMIITFYKKPMFDYEYIYKCCKTNSTGTSIPNFENTLCDISNKLYLKIEKIFDKNKMYNLINKIKYKTNFVLIVNYTVKKDNKHYHHYANITKITSSKILIVNDSQHMSIKNIKHLDKLLKNYPVSKNVDVYQYYTNRFGSKTYCKKNIKKYWKPCIYYITHMADMYY